MLEMLVDLEIAGKILSKDQDDDENKENPIDLHYRGLKTEIVSVDRNEDIFRTMKTFVKNSHGPTHNAYELEVMDLYTVAR